MLGILACLVTALQPTIELRQVTRLPNRVAVLVDASRSMEVRPPDGGPSRAERAAAMLTRAAPRLAAWQQAGHEVDLYSFGDNVSPATTASLREPPAADATRIGEALGDVRTRYAGRDLGAVVVISDGIDTGRIGEGPLDAATRTAIDALGAPVHTVGLGEKSLRDLSVAAVLADQFAFVRTPASIEAVIRQTGLPDRQVEVTLERDGRPIATRSVVLRGDRSEEKIAFDWLPDHPGNFVFRISTPVLGGEALKSNNEQAFALKVIRDRVRVLHLSGRPSWDERFLRAMLRRDPNVDLVSFFILRTESDEQPWNRNDLSLIPFPTYEIFEEQLRSFDLVIFQNFNYAPYGVEPFLSNVRDYVEGGGALAMVGGDLSFASGGYGATVLRDVLPVELPPTPPTMNGASDAADLTTDTFRPRLTPEGRTHPVTSLVLDPRENEQRWGKLPRAGGHQPRAARARRRDDAARPPDAEGRRRQAGAGAGGGRRGQGPGAGAADRQRLALGVPRRRRGRRRARVPALLGERHPLAGARSGADAAAAGARPPRVPAQPADRGARARDARGLLARARRRGDAGRGRFDGAGAAADAEPVRSLHATTDADGEAHVDVGTLPPGAYRLTGRATIDARAVTHDETFVVRAGGPELDDVAARDKVLREIAQASGGSYAFEELERRVDPLLARGAHRPPAVGRDLVGAAAAAHRHRAARARVGATPPPRAFLGVHGLGPS